ncbi:kinase [Sulfurimonas aquatica]|uniref:Kinase n=1 Tax=Sulfurimonas aquatica TaxID=2672570 RepID=A0A975B0G2_9BACT|nr:alpha-E domain-containing protein [Sulfurimonas aquatica]QSZ41924.1 kinase [Sulfurimonas aquatica]
MNHLITANVATNLYWLGRYLERMVVTLDEILVAYDKIIDVDKNAGKELYKKFDIELEYTDAIDFLQKAIFGEHSANLLSAVQNARESAIISRNHLHNNAFGETIELHALFQSASNSPVLVDYKLLDTAHSLIREIWGSVSKREYRSGRLLFFRLGKLVEEADYRIRFNLPDDMTVSVIKDIDHILKSLNEDYIPEEIDTTDMVKLLNQVNERIDKVIVD